MAAVVAEASAPGKLILMGEHAAVYGVPAVVTSVGLRTVVRVESEQRGEIDLDLSDFGIHEACHWNDVVAYGNRRRELWRSYRAEPSPERFVALRSGEEAGVVKIAIAETVRFLEQQGVTDFRRPVRIAVRSELPVGSGFGSSASVAVAVIAALTASLAAETTPEADTIARLAMEVEKRQHGEPSGIDHTTVMRGGFLLLRREDGVLRVTELSRPSWLSAGLTVFDSGAPLETTGEVVAAVRARRSADPAGFADLLERMASAVREFSEALGSETPDWPAVIDSVASFESCLETLEVVPAAVRATIRAIEAAGGAAKISGAGALSGTGAGSLIVFWPPDAEGEPRSMVGRLPVLDADLGGSGLEWRHNEEAEHAEA